MRSGTFAMKKYFVESKVTDKAIIGSVSDYVQIKDPCTGNTMVVIRNPKVKIQPYKSMDGVIDMSEHVSKCKVPNFYKAEVPLQFGNERVGWHNMLNLIKSKERQKQFWEFIEGLR